MGNFSNRREREEMEELLKAYHKLKSGRAAYFLEEDDFERIIDYFDDREEEKEALEAADLGLEQFPFAAQLMYKKADLLIAARRFEEALELLEKAELYDKNDISLFVLRIDAFLALEQSEHAYEVMLEALDLFEGDDKIELLFELADVFDDYEDFPKVFECLKLVLQEDPSNEEALLKICFWADFTGSSEESIRLHQWIIEQNPFSELAWFNLATAYQGLKLYEKAIDAYQYALAIDEKLDIAYRNLGDAYIRLRKYKEAIEALEKVLELSRPEDVIYEAIGHCYHKLEKYSQARSNYRKASHLNPGDSRLHYKIAVTYFREENWDNAIKSLETAMRTHRQQPDYNLLMGECLQRKGQLKDAIQHFALVVKAKPKSVSGREALIQCLLEGEHFEEALEQCKHALEVTGSNVSFLYLTSATYFLMGKVKEAMAQLENALSMQPKGFRKMLDLVPGLMHRPAVVDIVNRYISRRKPSRRSDQGPDLLK